jgi:ADP-heptose:LPS heptosyltransferase
VREEFGAEEDPDDLEDFFAAMQGERFDLALQMHGGGRHSNPFVLRLGARITAGLKAPDAPALDRWIPYVYFQPEILRFLEVARLVGAEPVTLEPRMAVTEQDLHEARAVVPDSERPLVVLHPGAGDPRRRWPPEKFAAVGDALAAGGARILVTGTGSEAPLVEGVVENMQAEAVSLYNALSLGGLAGMLSRCQMVVSNDSGPLHLAEAVGTPTVGVYWCGNLINAEPITRALHRPLLSWQLLCPVCGADCTQNDCQHRVSFVADLPVESVIETALDLWAYTSRNGAGAPRKALTVA